MGSLTFLRKVSVDEITWGKILKIIVIAYWQNYGLQQRKDQKSQ